MKTFLFALLLSAITLSSFAGSGITVSGSVRARMENWNWFETSAANPEYTFAAMLIRGSVGQQKPRFDWQVEAAIPVLIGIPDDAIAPAPQGQLGVGASYFAASGNQDARLNLKQAFLRIKGIAGDSASSLRLGRFEFSDGLETVPKDPTLASLKRDRISQRLIGPFGFTHIQRSFDGLQYVRNTLKHNFTFTGARITEGVFQLNAMEELDTGFLYGAYTHDLSRTGLKSEYRLFALFYQDTRSVLKTDNRPSAIRQTDKDNINMISIGGNLLFAKPAGNGIIDTLLWGVYQMGEWGVQDHSAGAISVEAGYQFGEKWNPWIRGGFFYGTGDDDPFDGDHNTFFQVLPTPRIYARFPFYNLMNLRDAFLEFRLKPHTKWSLRSDVRRLSLTSSNDFWYIGGGAFQGETFGYVGRPANGNSSLGTLIDISADWILSGKSSLTFYFATIRGGKVQSAIYPEGGANPAGSFFYIEMNQRF